MKKIAMMEYDDAYALVQACREKAKALNVAISIAVLDGAGNTISLSRFDNAAFQTPSVARGKALTAVMMRKPSGLIEKVTLDRLTMATFDDGRLPIQGGLPLMIGTECVGAVGASGGTPDQDEQIAQAAIDAFVRLLPE